MIHLKIQNKYSYLIINIKIKLQMSLYLLLVLITFSFCQYPEDYDDIQYLTNDLDGRKEYYVISFYPTSSSTAQPIYDLRNGIIIYPYPSFFSSVGTCSNNFLVFSNSPLTGSSATDDNWVKTTGTNPPLKQLIENGYRGTSTVIPLITPIALNSRTSKDVSFYEISNNLYTKTGVNAINYYWNRVSNSGTLRYYDITSSTCNTAGYSITYSINPVSNNDIFQTYIPLDGATPSNVFPREVFSLILHNLHRLTILN